ncbi:MAG: ZIP family zinc transporter [Methanobacterium sp.]|uniref:ZIP family metal transporter n=1 Tax=Methanobacterium sp. TaxID=2164 RepID=UPI003D65778E|nr:ZIP family zinc transporter [Methanobacterium sp.]
MIPEWIMAGLWGLIAGSALLIGALFAYLFKIPSRIVASIMAFGAGVLLSAISLELMEESFTLGGYYNMLIGFLMGAVIFTVINVYLARKGAKHRKRSQKQLGSDEDDSNSLAIAAGSVIDGIPESIAIGLTMITGGAVSVATVIAIFISNIPEGLSSTAGFKKAGWGFRPIFILWSVIAISSAIASLAGYSIFSHLPPSVISLTLALAAGGILAMLVDTMIPEAFSETHNMAGLITVLGFITSFILSKIG